ncbi:hypothetical protein WJX77_001558 [Trebouxia sp. C0004]
MKANLTVRINSKPPGAQGGGRQHGAAAYALLSAAATDVDSKKHKKNPFHERYVQLCLTEFGQGDKAQQENCSNGAVVDEVAENLHVRMELIKNMKQSLMKQTSNAIKSFQSQPQRSKQPPRKQTNQTAQKCLMTETDTDHVSGAFFRPEVYTNYLKLLQEEPVCDQDAQKLKERLLGYNPNTRPDSELCFDMGKQVSAVSLDTMLTRLFPDGDPIHVILDALLLEGRHTPSSLHKGLTTCPAANAQPQTRPGPEMLQATPNAATYSGLLAVIKPYAEDQQRWDVWADEEDSSMTEEDAQIELPSYIRPVSAAQPTPYPSILYPSHIALSPDITQLTAPAQVSQPAAPVDATASPQLLEPSQGPPPMHDAATDRQLHMHMSQLDKPPSQMTNNTAVSPFALIQAPACAVCPGNSCDEGDQPATEVATIIKSPASAVASGSEVAGRVPMDLGTIGSPIDDVIEGQHDEQTQGVIADFTAAASWPDQAAPAAHAESTMHVTADCNREVHGRGSGEAHSNSNGDVLSNASLERGSAGSVAVQHGLMISEAGEQQKQAPRLLPVLKRRTRALPSIALEEGVWTNIRYTGTDPGEEERRLVEGGNMDIIRDHPAQPGSSQDHLAPKRAPRLVPTLRKHRALAGQPSASQMGQIPFRAIPLRANNPSSPGQPNGFMASAEQVAVEPASEDKQGEEEARDHEDDFERGPAASSVARSMEAAASDQDDPIEEEDDADDRDRLPPGLNPHRGKKGRKQARRGPVSTPQPALVITPDFSESNLARIQQGPLFRIPLGQKVCYRPVFDVETLLTPPPDPFNLKLPAQHKRHHKGAASVVAASASTAMPGTVKIGMGMFRRSLLFDADLVQLKAEREAAQQSCELDDDVATGGFAEPDAMDAFGFADLDLDDDWDPVYGNDDSSSHHDRSAMVVDLSPQRHNMQMARFEHQTQESTVPGAASEAALYGDACAVHMPDCSQTRPAQTPDDDRHLVSATAAGSGQADEHEAQGPFARWPLLFDIDSDPEHSMTHQLEQQATQPAVKLPAVRHPSSPDGRRLVMDPDSPSGNHVIARHAQQPHNSRQQRAEPHVPSGPVTNLSLPTCELLMDIDSEREDHEAAQLEQQHRHTTWQQPSKNGSSLGPASRHAEPSATHGLMDMDSHFGSPCDPEDDRQQQQQQQQHGHQQQQVQGSVAGSCIPIIFDDYEEDSDFAPGPDVSWPEKQNQPQHDVQSNGHDQLQQWDAEEEQWQLQHPGSNITAATPAAADADATRGKFSQTPPTALPYTANAEPRQIAKSAAANLQYDQFKLQQSREAAESNPQVNSCPLVFGLEQEEEAGSQVMAESPADKEREAWQLQASRSGQQLQQQLAVGQQGMSPRLHAQLEAAQDRCPLVFDIESAEEDCYKSSMGAQLDNIGFEQQDMVSTAGHFGNSYPIADSAGQLSNSPPGCAPPEFRQSPGNPAVSGQFRQRPLAWDSSSLDGHRSAVQTQTGYEDSSQQHDQDMSHGQSCDQSARDQLCNNADQPDTSPDEGYCPILFGLESEGEEQPEGAEPQMAERTSLAEQADFDMMSHHEGAEWPAPQAGQVLAPPMVTHQPDVKKRSRIRDELYQGLMKRAMEQTAERSGGLQPLVAQLSKAINEGHMLPQSRQTLGAQVPNTLASLKEACLAMQSASSTAASTQKYFLALLILAQKINSLSHNMCPAGDPVHVIRQSDAAQPRHISLQRHTAVKSAADAPLTAEMLEVVLSGR